MLTSPLINQGDVGSGDESDRGSDREVEDISQISRSTSPLQKGSHRITHSYVYVLYNVHIELGIIMW